MLQQQSPTPQPYCFQCDKKQAMLHKFTELVHLLKKKNQRQDESRTKSTLQSQLNWVQNNTSHTQFIAKIIVFTERVGFRNIRCAFNKLQATLINLSVPFIADEAIIKYQNSQQASQRLKESCSTISKFSNLQNGHRWFKYSHSSQFKCDFLEELKLKNSSSILFKKVFELTYENKGLAFKLQRIENDLQENIRKQQREISKKRQSLQGLADQLSEKNEIIDQLKETIKLLQNKLGVRDSMVLHKLLEEDVQSLRLTIYKLENTNDKLNNDIAKIKAENNSIEKQKKQLLKYIEAYKSEIFSFKQSMFETEQEAQQNWLAKRELELFQQKITKKQEKIKKIEKKYSQMSRAKDSISTNPDQLTISKSEKKEEITTNSLHKNQEDKLGELQTKLEAVFSLLFNIENEEYQLHSSDLFDQEQKELLLTHQHKFIANTKANQLKTIDFPSKRCLEQNFQMLSLGDSLLEAFDQKPISVAPIIKDKIKCLDFELQRNKFIQKISQVKQKQLHLRCVILQLLKTLDLRTVKKETQGIVTLLCDLFEYSEEERGVLMQSKSRKFFGLI